jgi:hypothetical protein
LLPYDRNSPIKITLTFDAFISHSWEDKDDFVRELAEKLQQQRIEIWYDEFSLKIGDSLR